MSGPRATIESVDQFSNEALLSQTEAEAERLVAAWIITNGPVPRALQWRALLLRALDRHGEAADLLRRAAAADPQNPSIAQSLAQVSLEAGLPADTLFERALQLDPASSVGRLGLISAYFAAGKGQMALDLLEGALTANPGWIAGHAQFAQLSTLIGQPGRGLDTLLAAIDRFPDHLEFRIQALKILLLAGHFERALALAEASIARLGDLPVLLVDQAAALDELGQSAHAAAIFGKAGPAADCAHACWLLRHHLRRGDPATALVVAEPWLRHEQATQVWPYVALAWRMMDDPQADWLEAQPGLIGTADLAGKIDLAALADCLRRVHAGSGRFVDQSVRGGTQTDGPLFSRIEPEVAAARREISRAMRTHLAALPPIDRRHPQLAERRDRPVRYSGSWSVRLVDQGFHTSHHHPLGWFSAVFYLAAPPELAGEEGQLVLGAPPPELGLDLAAFRQFAPSPGKLVIFPSTMWHATLPFSKGERMTIAFDTARPFGGDMT
ncbi:MAG: putative 2OG-Fe(II) oxygenase [Novosphingobium sp.]|uniref:2OG-Fe(II) oxygenase family protein n=1 Tax=Novosphingobium sp. TaxID=1874826 RepID=UPI0032BBFEEC